MIKPRQLIGTHDVLFVTLDTLRYDTASKALVQGLTPNLARLLPNGQWEMRHTPATFTYAAHHAFFAGFLPTPIAPGPHPRLFAARFAGSETTTDDTYVFDTADIITGFRQNNYHTACIGGVGFFNKQNPLGKVLPDLFDESHWSTEMGVTSPTSAERQADVSIEIMSRLQADKRLFLFINISALHQPNCIFTPGATSDSADTQTQALAYVDIHLGRIFDALRARGNFLSIICSDHGTAYGEDGFSGHRFAHPVIWTVPYAEFVVTGAS